MELQDHRKRVLEDKELLSDLEEHDWSQHALKRVYAVKKVFRRVSFKQSRVDSCYFRNCRFIECDFTGAELRDTNLRGSDFDGCNFRYSTWHSTILDDHFLERCLPSEVNLARDLVRSLRVNYGQVGNYQAVNRAASIEVKLAGQHLYNAAYSRQAYYRAKYRGYDRILHVVRHLKWKALDLLWGNGESLARVLVSALVAGILCALIHMRKGTGLAFDQALLDTWSHFWGIQQQAAMSPILGGSVAAIRFIMLGLFMAILIKRLSRR